MIHIENITINIQAPSAESGPTSALGDALLHAMAESLFAEQTEELDNEVEAQPPINPARMNSMQQQADAWIAVCQLLTELRPGCFNGQGSGVEQALQAIRTMAEKQASAESQFV
mgnify:CR=1 FL=1